MAKNLVKNLAKILAKNLAKHLAKNPAKNLTDPCVFGHDCKSKDGDGGDAAPPPPPKKKSGGDGVPAGLGNAALRQLRAAKSG